MWCLCLRNLRPDVLSGTTAQVVLKRYTSDMQVPWRSGRTGTDLGVAEH